MVRMTRNAIVCGAAALLIGTTAIGATGPRVSGIVASKSDTSLQITTKAEGMKAVGVDATTHYIPWITYKPWVRNTRVDAATVTAGTCVDVEFRSNGASLAKLVKVSTERAGSRMDPCKTIRR